VLLGMELMSCPELAVPREIMHHIVQVESSRNPYAIGVVGGHLERQPRSLDEALATVQMLESRGFNFSVGLAQVNRYNLSKYGLDSYAQAFQICPNLQVGARILAECYQRHRDWGKSFSCYYSGNPVTGFRHGYVQKIFASMGRAQNAAGVAGAVVTTGIPVVAPPSRREVPVAHFPLQSPISRTEPGPSRIVANVGDVKAATDPALINGMPKLAATALPVPPIESAPVSIPTPREPVRSQPTPTPNAEPAPTLAPASAAFPEGDAAFVF